MKVEVTVVDAAVQAEFTHMLRAGLNQRGYLNAIGTDLLQSHKLRFIRSVSPEGKTWKPVLRGGQPLRNTGTHLLNPMNFKVQGRSILLGVPFAWGAVHQFGTSRAGRGRRTRIAARPFLGLSAGDKLDIVETLRAKLLP